MVFYVLAGGWSLLMAAYALDLPGPERSQALWPWLGGSLLAAVVSMAGHALQQGLQAIGSHHAQASALRARGATATAAVAEDPATAQPVLQLRAGFLRVQGQDPQQLLARLFGDDATQTATVHEPVGASAPLARRGMKLQVHFAQSIELLADALPNAAPVAVFTAAPPLTYASRYAAADWPGLIAAQTSATLPLLLRTHEQNTPSSAPVLQALHAQFTTAPFLCHAVLLSVDGDLVRGRHRHADTDTEPQPPPVQDTVVALWISRATLPGTIVEQAVDTATAEGQRRRQPLARWQQDLVEHAATYPHEPQATVWPAAFVEFVLTSGRESTAPEERALVQGLGPDLWYPVPWSQAQVEDHAQPPLATLWPALPLPLRDDTDAPFPPMVARQVIADAWQALLAQLPTAHAPLRLWYDSHAAPAVGIALIQALQQIAPTLDLDDAAVAIDLGTRLGPLGSASGAVALALAAHCDGTHVIALADGAGGLLLQALTTAPATYPSPSNSAPADAPHVPFSNDRGAP